MKFKVMVLSLLVMGMGITVSAWAQGGSVEKGKALVDSKKCALCHKEGSDKGKPMEMLVGTNSDTYLKDVIKTPKKVLKPEQKMPEFKLTDEQVNDIIAYLKSIAKK